MRNPCIKPAIGTEARDRFDEREQRRRRAYKNRKPCSCGSGRLAHPSNNKCIACDPMFQPAWDAWARTHKGSMT